MNNLLLALQFLTVIPVRPQKAERAQIAASLVYFPVVGLLIALSLAAVERLFLASSALFSSVLIVVSLVVLTGGMHLDGLADTLDALSSGKTKEGMLEIMRDPHVGVMGVLSVVCVILLKIAILASLARTDLLPALILTTTISRWSLILAMFLFPYARREGKAKAFMEGANARTLFRATALTLLIAAIAGFFKGIVAMAVAAALVSIFAKSISRKIGGITGDTLGFLNETGEISILLVLLLTTPTPSS